MKILILTQVLPYPPDSGPKVKTLNLIKYLSQENEITLVSFVRGDQEKEIQHLKSYCAEIFSIPITRGIAIDVIALVKSIFSGKPWIILRDYRQEMASLVDQLIEKRDFGAIHADQLYMAQYVEKTTKCLKILDDHNAMWQLYQGMSTASLNIGFRWLYQRDWPLVKTYEGRICREFDHILTVSEKDRAALEEAAGKKLSIQVVPITVDAQAEPAVVRSELSTHILHIGTMFWQPNYEGMLWFIQSVFPIIQQRKPGVVLDVVGANPPESLTKLNSQSIQIHGYVTDIRELIKTAGVFIVPVFAGSGMRVKILEALLRGIPVVTTTMGCEGIDVVDREEVYIADEPEEFAEAVIKLLEDHNESVRIANNGRQMVVNRYDLHQGLAPIRAIYSSI